jgi:hypothetical protein
MVRESRTVLEHDGLAREHHDLPACDADATAL